MNNRCPWIILVILLGFYAPGFAWQWLDLWQTPDQQAMQLMKQGQYQKAKDTFKRADWRATSAYRSGDYDEAAKLYQSLKNEDAYYNAGNALAHTGQYEKAIQAYNQALAMNPQNKDALYNRKVLEDLLKKEKKRQQNQDKQNQDKQNQDKQNQDKQNQDKQNQDKQNQDKQNQDKQNQDKQNQDKQNQDKQNQDKQNQDKQNQDKQNQDKQNQKNLKESQKNQEQAQAKDQWLRLIPDDPGGLLREKFLRDHLRRQHGWDQ